MELNANSGRFLVENKEEILDSREAARFLGLKGARVLERWRYEGRGPTFLRMTHGIVRYRRTDLIEFLKRSTVTPANSNLASA